MIVSIYPPAAQWLGMNAVQNDDAKDKKEATMNPEPVTPMPSQDSDEGAHLRRSTRSSTRKNASEIEVCLK